MKNFSLITNKYFYLLGSLLLYFLIAPFLIRDQFTDIILSLLISFIIVLCINVITRNRFLLITSIILGSIALTSNWIMNFTATNEVLNVIHHSTIFIFLIVMTFFVISAVAKHGEITENTLLGAICGYFLLGLVWSEAYLLISSIDPNAFIDHTTAVTVMAHSQQFIYYSFETLTTLGYGDILPASDVARTFSWLEAVTGQIYLAVWISQLVGLRIAQAVRENKNK